MTTFFTVLVLLAAVQLFIGIRVANEDERFAVITFGKFVGIKGPGLILHNPPLTKLVRLKLGTEGQIQSVTLVAIDGAALPFKSTGRVRPGMKVRVSGFEPTAVNVEALDQFVVCEKCGHKNVLKPTAY